MARTAETIVQELQAAMAAGDREKVIALVDDHHPADVAECLDMLLPEEVRPFLDMLDDDRLADVFDFVEDHILVELGPYLKPERFAQILGRMAPDEAADLVESLDEETSQSLLQVMGAEEAEELRSLLQYAPDTAGGLMTLDLVALRESLTVREAIEELRRQAPSDTETVYYAYVTDDRDRLVGVLSLRTLLASRDDQTVGEVMSDEVVSVRVHTDQSEVVELFEHYGFLALPVVANGGRLVGIVTVDDAMTAAEEEATEDIFRQGGLSVSDAEMLRSERIVLAPLADRLKIRLPWLMVVLVGGLLAGGVIGQFEEMLQAVVVLAFFIPVIMDMGGNVGTQASTIFVRGVVLGHIDVSKVTRYFARETFLGLVVGAVTGLGAGAIAALWQNDIRIGIVVFIAMALTCTLASFIGFFVPWLVQRFGFDPAAASNPLITTMKDITGLTIYFTTATLLLGHLT